MVRSSGIRFRLIHALMGFVEGVLTRRRFWVSITRLPDRSLLAVHGRVNARNSLCFRNSLDDAFNFSARPVVVDLRDAEFTDIDAVKALAASWDSAIRRGVPVELVLNVAGNLVPAD